MLPMNGPSPSLSDPEVTAVQGGMAYVTAVERRLAPYFERAEPRHRALAYPRGLLSAAERKTGWQLAESRGEPTPSAFQHVLWTGHWICPRRDGVGSVPEMGPRGPAGMTGAGYHWPTPWSPPGGVGCWSGGVCVTPRSGTPTWSLPRRTLRWKRSSGWPARGGPWRAASKPSNARGVWRILRCAVGPAGIDLARA
jgi:hypothetical protein